MAEPSDPMPPIGGAEPRRTPVDVPGTSVLVVMGVSGVGKTTVGLALAERLGWAYQEGDLLHPPENVAKMRAGTPLTDEDRRPWLRTIAALIDRWRAEGRRGIITCSALKRAYRRIIVGDRPDVHLVYLTGEEPLIGSRLATRRGHYMPPSLLKSQIAALEEPGPDERPITAPVDQPVEIVVARILEALGIGRGAPGEPGSRPPARS